ncbi:MAG: S8 family serine peptidase [Phycisphaeraceae bacterium]|nr:S8 family serine peptidase [Phycisphaeraceae bacterium]
MKWVRDRIALCLGALMACAAWAAGSDDVRALHAAGIAPDDPRAALHTLLEDPTVWIEYDPFTILVQLAPGAGPEAIAAVVGGTVLDEFTLVPGLVHISLGGGVSVEQAILTLSQPLLAGSVIYAEPDYIVRTCGIPNDTHFSRLWGMHNTGQNVNGIVGKPDADIDAPEAWDSYTGNPNFVIAIIDTGINYTHPDLMANRWVNPGEIPNNGIDDDGNGYIDDVYGWNFYNNNNNPYDTGHGTHVAGTVGAVGNNGQGVVGVNWQCKLMALKFLGSGGGTISGAINSLQYSVAKGVKVSNNSWSGGGYSSSLFNAIENSKSVGHIFVCAAGNDGLNIDSFPVYPASYTNTNLLAVAATTSNDTRASFSNYGKNTVDLGAPGANVYSTYGTSGYAYMDGTSMASPHAAGVVALVYGKNPNQPWNTVYQQVMTTTRPIAALANITVTGGVVNAADAVGYTPNQPPVLTVTGPANGSVFVVGTPVTFSGTAIDPEDGNISSQIVWVSHADGVIGTGANVTTSSLSLGIHYMMPSVTDSGGLTDDDFFSIQIVPASIPNAPTIVSGEEGNPGQGVVVWADNSNNETGFQIQRQQKVAGKWVSNTIVGSVGPNVTTFIDNVGQGGWRYRVRANGSGGYSAWSGWIVLRAATPAKPTVSASGGTIFVGWNDPSGIESGFEIQRQQRVGNAWTNTTVIGTVGADVTGTTDNPPSGRYRYRVRTLSDGRISTWSVWSAAVDN